MTPVELLERKPDLLERTAELAEVSRALAAARSADGTLLAIDGPAGIGKSRLLDATRAAGTKEGFRVLTARGELERDFTYGVVRQLLKRDARGILTRGAGRDARGVTRARRSTAPLTAAARAPRVRPSACRARPAR